MFEKISVVIATYKGEKYLKQQLDSILQQLPINAEVIISDDGSTDKTIDIIRQLNHPQIRLVKNMGRKGVTGNFENSISLATGDFIFLSDQDDLWKPDKIKVCLEYLMRYDVVVSDCEIIDEQNNVVIPSYFARRKSGKGLLKNLWANTYIGCCIAFKKSILKTLLPFPADIPLHDIWIGFVGEVFYKTHFIAKPLVAYRMHEQNISPTTVGISPFNIFSKFGFRWNVVKYLPTLLMRNFKTSPSNHIVAAPKTNKA